MPPGNRWASAPGSPSVLIDPTSARFTSLASRPRMLVPLAVRPLQQLVRLGVADDLALLVIPRQRPAAELHRDVGQQTGRRRNVTLLDVRGRLRAFLDRLQEAALVAAV